MFEINLRKYVIKKEKRKMFKLTILLSNKKSRNEKFRRSFRGIFSVEQNRNCNNNRLSIVLKILGGLQNSKSPLSSLNFKEKVHFSYFNINTVLLIERVDHKFVFVKTEDKSWYGNRKVH